MTAVAAALANGSIRKSFFRMLVEKVANEQDRERGKTGEERERGDGRGTGKNSRSVMHVELNRQRKICARVCARVWLSKRPRYSPEGINGEPG